MEADSDSGWHFLCGQPPVSLHVVAQLDIMVAQI